MSIAVCCTLADGVVLGADSAVTVVGTRNKPDGSQETGVLKVYNDAEKIFSVHKLPVGIVTFGLATVANRTLKSLVRQFEIEHSPDQVRGENVEGFARLLYRFLHEQYLQSVGASYEEQTGKPLTKVPDEKRPGLALFVGGFSPGSPLPECWRVFAHFSNEQAAITQVRKPGDFGSNWGGQYDGVQRFHKGFEPPIIEAAVRAVVERLQLKPTEEQAKGISEAVAKAVGRFEYQVPFAAMPLQEGIDYVKFLLYLMISQHRFVVGAPTCGGKVSIAVVRQDEALEWVTETGFEQRAF